METITKTAVEAVVGPAQLAAGVVTLHEYQLDGDENLVMGQRVEVKDESGAYYAATITGHSGLTWELTLQP